MDALDQKIRAEFEKLKKSGATGIAKVKESGDKDQKKVNIDNLCSLNIESDPTEAEVEIDNEYYGNTPIKINLKPNKSYNISIKKTGFKIWSKKLRTTENGNINIKAELVKDTK